tara:strand:+ start:272 stop:502 length:231 start_codon:yes stop_codon:yes gene_type:complete
MDYDNLIKTVSEIVENENIFKGGLILVYELDEINHMKMDEHLFYKSSKDSLTGEFIHNDVIEIEISGILVKLIKKK